MFRDNSRIDDPEAFSTIAGNRAQFLQTGFGGYVGAACRSQIGLQTLDACRNRSQLRPFLR